MYPDQIVLVSSQFKTYGQPDTHKTSDWEIADNRVSGNVLWQANTLGDASITVVNEDVTSLTSANRVYASVRHNGASGAVSGWSSRKAIVFKPVYKAPLIGIRGVFNQELGRFDISHVDQNGERIARLVSNYFDLHPWYSGLSESVLDGQTMVRIMPYWAKAAGNDEEFFYWIAPYEFEGSILHPMFKKSLNLFIGKYGASLTGNILCSTNVAPSSGISGSSLYGYGDNRNVNGQIGWHGMSIYEYAGVSLPALIEQKTFSVTSTFGTGVNSIWRPFKGFWAAYYGRMAMLGIGGNTTNDILLSPPDNLKNLLVSGRKSPINSSVLNVNCLKLHRGVVIGETYTLWDLLFVAAEGSIDISKGNRYELIVKARPDPTASAHTCSVYPDNGTVQEPSSFCIGANNSPNQFGVFNNAGYARLGKWL